MDSTRKYINVSPEEKASFISKAFYWWFLPFFKYAYQNGVQLRDVYNATKSDLSQPIADKLERNWKKEIAKKKPSLKKAIFNTFWKPYSIPGIALLIQNAGIRMLQPLVLVQFINVFSKTDNEPYFEWIWGSLVVIMAFTNVFTYHLTCLYDQRVGMKIRIGVCSLIYRKLLKLNQASLAKTSAGQLINILSNDVQRFDMACTTAHYIWISPFVIIIAFYILCSYVGYIVAVIGMLFMVLQSFPLQGAIAKYQGKLRQEIALKTDKRVKLMSELTSGIQVIKMYAWEKPFEKVVQLCRKLEVDMISKSSYCAGVFSAMAVFTERLILYGTVVLSAVFGNILTGNLVFSLAQFFNNVQFTLTVMLPLGLSYFSQTCVSIRRIEELLLLEEKEESKISNEKKNCHSDLGDIRLIDVTASWEIGSLKPTLKDVTLHVPPGSLCCVVGNVGCGKSSLLHLLLQELPCIRGRVNINGNIAYASQQPWLFVSNVRDNILFGRPFQQQKYEDVIRVCSLEKDFDQLPFGDRTSVGEKGVSLSGGQRARVNLARAVYTDADIYLFDDPLSAVDTKVARHLFNECIATYLNGKTRILVTHQLQFLKKSDVTIFMNDGKIENIVNLSELTEADLKTIQEKYGINKEKDPKEKLLKRLSGDIENGNLEQPNHLENVEDAQETDELIEKGIVPNSVYWDYWFAGNGIGFFIFTCFIFILSQMVTNASDLWLMHWTNVEAARYALHPSNTTLKTVANATNIENSIELTSTFPSIILTTKKTAPTNITTVETIKIEDYEYYIWVYTVLIVACILLVIYRCILYFQMCMASSRAIHNNMFHNILEASMRFFDTNPSGRILNRFSKDMGAVDETLSRYQLEALQVFTVSCGILIIDIILIPWITVAIVPLLFLCYFLRKMFLNTSQSIKRLEGITRAPVFSHVSASLQGITTIRSSKAEKLVSSEFDELQDQHTSTWVMLLVSSTAFGFYLDVIGVVFLACMICQFLIFKDENTLGGNVGLAVSQTIILTYIVQHGIRNSIEHANSMISVERIFQYSKLPKEGPFQTVPTNKPPLNWPNKGQISFRNVYMRYSPDSPTILKNLNITIKSSEKIGIVGRTGAGKSSIIVSLFRLTPIDGAITIDDIDISNIGLTDLRLKISIIPQEPIIFSATIRYNLDPFDNHSDEVLWTALENVELKDVVKDLNQMVNEGGSNFSVGQRQLICLARAIVRNNKILVMDEATANVDPETDNLIQKTIRERFKDCTVLTVAHRLNTVIDSDKVLVIDEGEIKEFDHAYELLRNPEGYFSKMVKETGEDMEKKLREIAARDYHKRMHNEF